MTAAYVAGNRGFDALNSNNRATANFAVSGSNKFLLALAFSGAGTPQNISTATWNGAQSLTQIGAYQNIGVNFRASAWGLIAPADATAAVNFVWADVQDERLVLAACFSGVDQATPYRTPPTPGTGTNLDPTVNVTTVAGDRVVTLMAAGITASVLTTLAADNGTMRHEIEGNDIGGFECAGMSDDVAAGTSLAMNMTISESGGGGTITGWVSFGLALIDASAAAPASFLPMPAWRRFRHMIVR